MKLDLAAEFETLTDGASMNKPLKLDKGLNFDCNYMYILDTG